MKPHAPTHAARNELTTSQGWSIDGNAGTIVDRTRARVAAAPEPDCAGHVPYGKAGIDFVACDGYRMGPAEEGGGNAL
jgi:hypothetical protein